MTNNEKFVLGAFALIIFSLFAAYIFAEAMFGAGSVVR